MENTELKKEIDEMKEQVEEIKEKVQELVLALHQNDIRIKQTIESLPASDEESEDNGM